LSLCLAEKGFHPRFDATSRVYRYTIWNHPVRNPLLRRTALWVSDSLDSASMSEALDLLVGEHDFATFGTAPGGGRTTVRRVHCVKCYAAGQVGPWDNQLGCMPEKISIRPVRHQRVGLEPMVYVDIEANAFLYRMVRSIVGTILQVGRGQLSVAEFASVFAAAERSRAGPTAPPHGLCLVAVRY
jgi:tRNA pseudouridine38-40 synthase